MTIGPFFKSRHMNTYTVVVLGVRNIERASSRSSVMPTPWLRLMPTLSKRTSGGAVAFVGHR
jgi:hypothetical protein